MSTEIKDNLGQVVAHNMPDNYENLLIESKDINFGMCSDAYTGSLLRSLVSSKPRGRILELGTGTGLSLSWILDGADKEAQIITIDNDPKLLALVCAYFEKDSRLSVICEDAGSWLSDYHGPPFDVIFADAWPGKFHLLPEALHHLKAGGFYIIDDLLPRSNWPEGHHEKVTDLIKQLEARPDLNIIKLNWSTGLIVATKKHFESIDDTTNFQYIKSKTQP